MRNMILTDKILQFIKNNGSISNREAFLDLDITSASFSRRVCDLEEVGFNIKRQRKTNPVTGKRYTRYSVDGTKEGSVAERRWAQVHRTLPQFAA